MRELSHLRTGRRMGGEAPQVEIKLFILFLIKARVGTFVEVGGQGLTSASDGRLAPREHSARPLAVSGPRDSVRPAGR